MDDALKPDVTDLEGRIRQVVEEVIQGTPLYLVDLSVRGRKGSQVVEVFIDSDGPLTVDDLAQVSREIGFLLDTEEVVPGGYHLNVSSPGVNRPLTLPRQFKKNINRRLKVKYRSAESDGVATAEGELARVDDEGIELETAKAVPIRIGFEDIVEAKVQLPW